MRTSESLPLRVAVNAYFERFPLTGSGQYLARLLGALAAEDSNIAVCTLGGKSWGRKPGAGSPAPAVVKWLQKLWLEQVAIPRSLAADRYDLVHYPYWAAPLLCPLPAVITVHDLIPLVLPGYRGAVLARAYTRLQAMASRRATMLIADSVSSQRDIMAALGVPAERVRVVYLAADQRFRAAGVADDTKVRSRYGVSRPFVFYVGGLDARKNVATLIAAFARAKPDLPGYVLAIAGDHRRRGPLFHDLEALARQSGVGDAVSFIGVVEEDDLPALYRSASAVAFPSIYEGFGLPPLEALACGAPLLCSNASSLPEVVGDAALLLDPRDEDAWAAGLVRVLRDEPWRQELKRRGPIQALKFNWATTAAETAAVYREAVSVDRR